MIKSQDSQNLYCNNLSVGYTNNGNKKIILEDINLSLKKGNFISLVGINGSGKSTLLRTLAGLQKALEGEVYLDKRKIAAIDPVQKSKTLSLVLTNQQISKNLTVLELVALGRQPYTNWLGTLTDSDKEHILEAIRATELENFKNTSCFELSDGQFQRALIARALAQNTEIILLDEPTTHLDLHHKASIFLLLKKIAHTHNKLILSTTHDIEFVLSLCDQMIVIKGKTCITDTPDNLIKSGVFENLFPDNTIGFNTQSKQFFIR